jgi:hypothetical protein
LPDTLASMIVIDSGEILYHPAQFVFRNLRMPSALLK